MYPAKFDPVPGLFGLIKNTQITRYAYLGPFNSNTATIVLAAADVKEGELENLEAV